jgi:hypothetical protein
VPLAGVGLDGVVGVELRLKLRLHVRWGWGGRGGHLVHDVVSHEKA